MLSPVEHLMYFHPASHFGRLERRPSEIDAFEELESRPFRRSHADDAERFDTPWGVRDVVVTVAILFALSTVLAWGYYGEQAWTWLFSGRKGSRFAYRAFLCVVLAVAPVFDRDQVTSIVDSLTFAGAIPNLIAVYLLLPELRADLASYWERVVRKEKKHEQGIA